MAEPSEILKKPHGEMEDLDSLSKSELITKLRDQEQYIKQLESKRPRLDGEEDVEATMTEKLKQQHRDAARRENTLVHRLTTKEQELQDYMNQIAEIKQAQTQGTAQLRSTLLDPAINIVFQRMAKEMDDAQEKLKQTQNELSAWKFTPDSQTGKKLMARCQMLLQENEELGKTIASGKTAKLEGEIALQKTLVTEMKNNQSDLDEFLGELEEDVEGMQTMILVLQQQLRESKDQIAALQEENTQLREGGTYSPKHRDKTGTKLKTEEVGPFKCNVKAEGSEISSYSRRFSSNFTPMETNYEKEGEGGDGEYGQGEGYSQYEDDSYYDDYRENYSPYVSNKDSKFGYEENEYSNGFEERTERSEKIKDGHEPGQKHESMDVDESPSELTSNSENPHSSAKEIKIEKPNITHGEVTQPNKHSIEDEEMTAISQETQEYKNRTEHEVVDRQQESSHHKRHVEMEQDHEEVSSTVDSSIHSSSQREYRESRHSSQREYRDSHRSSEREYRDSHRSTEREYRDSRHSTEKEYRDTRHSSPRENRDSGHSSQRENRDSYHTSPRENRDSRHSSPRENRDSHHTSPRENRDSHHSSKRDNRGSRHSSERENRDTRHSSERENRDTRHSSPRENRDTHHSSPRENRDSHHTSPRENRDSYHTSPRDNKDSHHSSPRENRDSYRTSPRDNKDSHHSSPRENRDSYRTSPRDNKDSHHSSPKENRDSHHSCPKENRDSQSLERNKHSTSPQNKFTRDDLPDEEDNSIVQSETQLKTDNKSLIENSELTEKVSPNRTKGSMQLLIEPKPPKNNSPTKDSTTDRHSPKPHLSPGRTISPKGRMSPHKDKSPSSNGNNDGENSPQTNSSPKANSPNKDSPNAATSPFKEREPVLQKFLNGVTSTVDDIEDL